MILSNLRCLILMANEWLVQKTLSHFDEYSQLPTLDVFKNEVNKVERDVLKQSIVDNLKQAGIT